MNAELTRLIMACVDGELSPAEEHRLQALLKQHPEAVRLLDQLRKDRDAIQQLPRRRLDPEFANRLVRSLPVRRLAQPKLTPVPSRSHAWWPMAAAAVILLAVSVAAALFVYDLTRPEPDQNNWAVRPPDPVGEFPFSSKGSQSRDENGSVAGKAPAQPAVTDAPAVAKTQPPAFELLPDDLLRPVLPSDPSDKPATAQGPSSGANSERGPAEEAPFAQPPVLTAPPSRPLGEFKTLDLKLALFLDPRDLDLQALSEQLASGPMHHFDIACLDSARTFERFQTACKAAGVKLLVENELNQRLSRKLPTPCLIYLENTSPGQVAALMKALSQEEIKAEDSRKGDGQILSILAQPLDEAGRKHLADALGVSVSAVTPPQQRSDSPPGSDPTRPLSEDTLRSLEKLVSKSREPTALALIYLPNRTRMLPTRELKQFLDARLGMAPDAIHVVIFLRAARG